jgi:tetratricopeptide (TPR) repeat protein
MAIRLLFLLFVVILVAFSYISLLNGQHVPFYYSATRQMEVTVSELAILSFSLGAAMVILGTLVKDVTSASRTWRERREKQRRDAAKARAARAGELVQRGMLQEAVRELTRSLSVNPDDREALDLLAAAQEELGNPLEAVKALTRVKQIEPSDLSAYFRLARLYRKMNDPEAALHVLSAVESAEGENPRAWEATRDIHLSRGEMVPAYNEQKKLMKLRGKDASAADTALFHALRYEKALVRQAQGKTDDAERRLRDVIRDDPSFCASYAALSDLLRGRDLEGATDVLLQGFRATRNPIFLIRLEDLCVETERPQAMIRIYSLLQREFPSDYDVNLFAGKFFLRLEMIDEALEQLLKAETLDPDRESVNVLLAEAYRRRGRYEQASQRYQRAYGYKRRYLIPFRCRSCGSSTIKWTARCPSCGAWNSYAIDHGNREYSISATPR